MPSLPEPGTEWAGFHIEGQVGEGGFGRVFTAWDPSLDRRVAIKVLVGPGNSTEVDATVRERFLRESRVAARLDHPRIVPIFAADELDGVPYIVMRHVGGGDLREEIRQSPLTLDRTISVVGQVASALDRAHRGGLVHRDVKPANILCAEDSGDVYLTDFGIIRFMEETTDQGLTLTGAGPPASPHYASPEQLRGETLRPTADVYSLGCTLFECLTGRVPFTGGTSIEIAHHQLHTDPPSISATRPDLPAALDDIVARAMAKDPDARFLSCAALADALAGIGEPRAAAAPVPPARPDVETPSVKPGRSVFELDDEAPSGATTSPSAPFVDEPPAAGAPTTGPDDTALHAPVPAAAYRPDGAVDGSVFGVWEDDAPRNRTPWIIGLVIAAMALVVGALVWRAVNTDADLAAPGDATTTTTSAPGDDGFTLDRLATFVPDTITSCGPPAEQPTDEPRRLVLQCPLNDDPDLVSFDLFEDVAARDQRFDAIVAFGGLTADGSECGLGQSGVGRFAGDRYSGRVACRIDGGAHDILWTRDDQPVLVFTSGVGRYRDDYDFFATVVGRTDDSFPLPLETELLGRLPDELTENCRRDLDLTIDAGGTVAIACEPADQEAEVVSWVGFDDPDAMTDWIEARRGGLSNTFSTEDDACTPSGFGTVDEGVDDDDDDDDDDPPPAPDAGFTDYDLDGITGRVLCFVNSSRQNVVFWTRTGELLGSIAVSSAEGQSMADLLSWWEDDGHLP